MTKINESKILKHIQIVDQRLAEGSAKILSLDEVLKRLKANRKGRIKLKKLPKEIKLW
jgi:hypothetical protein